MMYVDPASNSFALRSAESFGGPARQEAVLKEFEQVFINQLLKEMRKSLPEGGLMPKSQQQQYFEEVFDDNLAGEMARSGQFGIARQMQDQLAQVEAARKRDLTSVSGIGLPLTPERTGLALKPASAGLALPKKTEGLPPRPASTGLPLR
jgi:flagellar protein FlgJ